MRNKKEQVRFAYWFKQKTMVLQEVIYGKPDLGLMVDQGQRCKIDVKEGAAKMVRYGTPQGNLWLYSCVAEDFGCYLNNLALS
ncbi:hypothetical protein MIH18_05920 [Marinobacter sp. M3C]|jgi:hypothetical protein|uniref:hypothetical protein n=1 Tax=unclassified Marinobacter TaxID=83889 RepID=UPI00200F8E0D|nr:MULTISPECIES: hypothetical protein [unclassified Marinobacter]MCL1476819.1 hypothetical protein [Marinobacter sp.]MCL1479921.1 hypothetical protein [Marinobacter sp.]UQG57347.1 hypothetical protein MIH16_06810 [Marinobacter sp. M4C]UQG61479.1 hypothetical protein MIH18_05920 [Marinobacter sp. M3C]UQG66151.1 hypothetical protein MIH17_06810 [Marinobacter sp. M2C]